MVAARRRYLSEKKPDATTQMEANTYGGALSPWRVSSATRTDDNARPTWASAAVKPMFLTIVGSDNEKP